MNGYRVHPFDLGEVRWLRALAERAGVRIPAAEPAALPPHTGVEEEAPPAPPEPDPGELALGRELAELQRAAGRIPDADAAGPAAAGTAAGGPGEDSAALDMTALEAQIRAEAMNAFEFAAGSGGAAPENGLDDLVRAANRLPGAVRRRLGDARGIAVTQALARLRDPREADAARAELRAAAAGPRAPRWMEELAAALLLDTGAQTREGLRTESLRLDPAEESDGGYVATEVESGTHGHLSPSCLIEQVCSGLAFAGRARSAFDTAWNARFRAHPVAYVPCR